MVSCFSQGTLVLVLEMKKAEVTDNSTLHEIPAGDIDCPWLKFTLRVPFRLFKLLDQLIDG
jgi:hypothetical protein